MKFDAAKLDRRMRGVRIAVGLVALSLTVIGPQSPWGYLGIVPIVVGATGACPVSRLFGRRTCPSPPATQEAR